MNIQNISKVKLSQVNPDEFKPKVLLCINCTGDEVVQSNTIDGDGKFIHCVYAGIDANDVPFHPWTVDWLIQSCKDERLIVDRSLYMKTKDVTMIMDMVSHMFDTTDITVRVGSIR